MERENASLIWLAPNFVEVIGGLSLFQIIQVSLQVLIQWNIPTCPSIAATVVVHVLNQVFARSTTTRVGYQFDLGRVVDGCAHHICAFCSTVV
jgi:hypothetical protein